MWGQIQVTDLLEEWLRMDNELAYFINTAAEYLDSCGRMMSENRDISDQDLYNINQLGWRLVNLSKAIKEKRNVVT